MPTNRTKCHYKHCMTFKTPANTYDDKVAVIRMIVGDEAGKVSNVFRQLMKKDAL